jgi:hypothetical protein
MQTAKLPTDISLSVKSATPMVLATDAVPNRTARMLLFLYLIDCSMINRFMTPLFWAVKKQKTGGGGMKFGSDIGFFCFFFRHCLNCDLFD